MPSTEVKLGPLSQLYYDEVLKVRNPKFQIKMKSDSKLHLYISKIVKSFNPDYMKSYITTIDGTMWLPSDPIPDENLLDIMVHEGIHDDDRMKLTSLIFDFLYLFPQTLCLILVLAALFLVIFGLGWASLVCLILGLAFLAPIPAPFRFLFELKAYRTSLIFTKYVWQSDPSRDRRIIDNIIAQLCTKLYYWCWPFKTHVAKLLGDESVLKSETYTHIFDFLKRHEMLNVEGKKIC